MSTRRCLFVTGWYEALRFWTTADFGFALLLDTWVPDESTDVYMADVAAFELTDASYSRIAVTTPTVSLLPAVSAGQDAIIALLCDNAAFGILSGGEVATSVVCFNDVTNDADSPLVCSWPCVYTADGIGNATFHFGANGAVNAHTLCGNPPV